LGNCSIRLLKPECTFDNQWCDEPLPRQASRVVECLYYQSVPENVDEYSASVNDKKALFPGSCFAFMFYLLNGVLVDNGVAVGGDSAVMSYALKIISTHANMRSDSTDEVIALVTKINVNVVQFRNYNEEQLGT